MNPNPDPRQFFGVGSAVLVVPIVLGIKRTFPTLDSRWWPAVTLAVAIVFNLGLGYLLGADLRVAAFLGLVTGLSASGLYSWTTAMSTTLAARWTSKVTGPKD